MSFRFAFRRSFGHLQDVLAGCVACLGKTSFRHHVDVFLLTGGGFILSVCSCHVTYAFQSESTLYSCLNVKELFARSRREIWSLSDCNWTRTQKDLLCKWTLNQLTSSAKWLSAHLRTYWFWGQEQLQSLKSILLPFLMDF